MVSRPLLVFGIVVEILLLDSDGSSPLPRKADETYLSFFSPHPSFIFPSHKAPALKYVLEIGEHQFPLPSKIRSVVMLFPPTSYGGLALALIGQPHLQDPRTLGSYRLGPGVSDAKIIPAEAKELSRKFEVAVLLEKSAPV